MNGTEFTERLIKDLDHAIKKRSSLDDVGQAALSVIANGLRIIMETINSSDQLIAFDQSNLLKALEDIKQHKAEISNRIDVVLQDDSLVSRTERSADGKAKSISEILIKQMDFISQTFGAK